MKIYILCDNDVLIEAYFSAERAEEEASKRNKAREDCRHYYHIHSVEVKDDTSRT
jgi:hypothetical protein